MASLKILGVGHGHLTPSTPFGLCWVLWSLYYLTWAKLSFIH